MWNCSGVARVSHCRSCDSVHFMKKIWKFRMVLKCHRNNKKWSTLWGGVAISCTVNIRWALQNTDRDSKIQITPRRVGIKIAHIGPKYAQNRSASGGSAPRPPLGAPPVVHHYCRFAPAVGKLAATPVIHGLSGATITCYWVWAA